MIYKFFQILPIKYLENPERLLLYIKTAPSLSTSVICIDGDFIFRYVKRIWRWMLSTDCKKSQKYRPVALIMSSYLADDFYLITLRNIYSRSWLSSPEVTEKPHETSPEENHEIIILFSGDFR